MRKEAVGIAINGREVKIAHVYLEKNRLAVDFLESATLVSDLDDIHARSKKMKKAEATVLEEDAFELEETYQEKETPKEEETGQKNVDILYSLLRKFAAKKIKVGFNIQPTRVSYQDLDTHLDYNKNAFRGSLRGKIDQWKQGFNALDNVSVITRKDGTLCNIFCDTQQPPIINVLEQINAFYKGNLFLSLMDSNEISLVNLTRASYNFDYTSDVSVIVEVENEFSRIIFMKGEDLLNVSQIITEKFSPDLVKIIYSKIIYELDNLNIKKVANILLSGKASTFNAKSFFEKKFPGVEVGFVVSQPLAENLSTQFSRENLSEYAIPIALAWKVVDPKNESFIHTNLLPSHIIDRQKLIKLSFASYILLFLLGATAFFFTLKITAKKLEINSIKRKNAALTKRINNSEQTVKLVHEKESQIAMLEKRLSLSDSLSSGADQLLSFLEKLNESVLTNRSIWIDELQSGSKGLIVKGRSTRRSSAPQLSQALGGGKIKKLIRNDSEGRSNLYTFEMEVEWNEQYYDSRFKREEIPGGVPLERGGDNQTILASNNDEIIASELSKNTALNDYLAEDDLSQNVISSKSGNGGQDKSPEAESFSNTSSEQNYATADESMNSDQEQPSYESKNIGNDYSNFDNSSEADQNGNYTIRISAHIIRLTAEKEIKLYQKKGYDVSIVSLPQSRTSLPYWVCYGQFSSRAEAQQEIQELKNVVLRDYQIFENPSGDFMALRPTGSQNRNSNRTVIQKQHEAAEITSATHEVETGSAQPAISPAFETTPERSYQKSAVSYNQTGDFIIRLSAHVTKVTARRDLQRYRSQGYDPYLTTEFQNSREIPYWVCVGRFDSYDQALAMLEEINGVIPGEYSVVSVN